MGQTTWLMSGMTQIVPVINYMCRTRLRWPRCNCRSRHTIISYCVLYHYFVCVLQVQAQRDELAQFQVTCTHYHYIYIIVYISGHLWQACIHPQCNPCCCHSKQCYRNIQVIVKQQCSKVTRSVPARIRSLIHIAYRNHNHHHCIPGSVPPPWAGAGGPQGQQRPSQQAACTGCLWCYVVLRHISNPEERGVVWDAEELQGSDEATGGVQARDCHIILCSVCVYICLMLCYAAVLLCVILFFIII